jgi:DNA-binding NarL/FixJ family response regulator
MNITCIIVDDEPIARKGLQRYAEQLPFLEVKHILPDALAAMEVLSTEAIDLMIRTIHCGNGYTGSFLEEPSLDALVKMGRMSVPKLTKALKREHDEYRRIQISHCLTSISYH